MTTDDKEMKRIIKEHMGHSLTCAYYAKGDNGLEEADSVTIECEDCCCV